MNLTELLQGEIEAVYGAAFGLLNHVDGDRLDWKPATGENWMTMGQLLMHLTSACGFCCRGMVTGDWRLPDGTDLAQMSDEDMLPGADKLPAVSSVAEARAMLEEDKALALRMVAEAGEEALASREAAAPWLPEMKMPLGRHLKQMVDHLAVHKAQLFYYLKLQGKPVHTGHLWGMEL